VLHGFVVVVIYFPEVVVALELERPEVILSERVVALIKVVKFFDAEEDLRLHFSGKRSYPVRNYDGAASERLAKRHRLGHGSWLFGRPFFNSSTGVVFRRIEESTGFDYNL
jgi:hypothetical protein